MLVASLMAFFADPPFPTVGRTEHCELRKRPKTDERGAAMWARCVWPGIDPTRVRTRLLELDRYAEWIWPIAESRILREESGRLLVYQRQEVWALADREVLLWVRPQRASDMVVVSWEAASELPLRLQPGSVRTPRNTGFWAVRPAGDGVEVVHQIELDAGGLPLPRWLVRAIQTRGFARILRDLREASSGP